MTLVAQASRRSAWLCILVLGSLGAGCRQEGRLSLAANGARPAFVASAGWWGDTCVHGFSIRDLADAPAHYRWAIVRTGTRLTDPCTNHLTYGAIPHGYAHTAGTAAPLAARHRYRATAHGAGWDAQADFTIPAR